MWQNSSDRTFAERLIWFFRELQWSRELAGDSLMYNIWIWFFSPATHVRRHELCRFLAMQIYKQASAKYRRCYIHLGTDLPCWDYCTYRFFFRCGMCANMCIYSRERPFCYLSNTAHIFFQMSWKMHDEELKTHYHIFRTVCKYNNVTVATC